MHGYTQSLDYTHMYNVPDIKKRNVAVPKDGIPVYQFAQNTIAGVLNDDPEFSYFNYILYRSGLQEKFGNCDKHTLFAVPNNQIFNTSCGVMNEEFILSMDSWTAKKIILSHTFDKFYSEQDIATGIRRIPNMYGDDIVVDKNYYADAIIMGYKQIVNGSIFIIDQLQCPTTPY